MTDWYTECLANSTFQHLSHTPWYIIQGSAFVSLLQMWFLLALPRPRTSSESSDDGAALLDGASCKAIYAGYRFVAFTWQLVIDAAMLGEYFPKTGNFSAWQNLVCMAQLLSASPNAKNSCTWLSVILALLLSSDLARTTRLCTFREHVLMKAFVVYFTLMSVPYALVLVWTLIPGIFWMWVLIPGMIVCLSISPYLLRQPAMEQFYDSEEEWDCVEVDLEGTALERPLQLAGYLWWILPLLDVSCIISPPILMTWWGTDSGYWISGLMIFDDNDLFKYFRELLSFWGLSYVQWLL